LVDAHYGAGGACQKCLRSKLTVDEARQQIGITHNELAHAQSEVKSMKTTLESIKKEVEAKKKDIISLAFEDGEKRKEAREKFLKDEKESRNKVLLSLEELKKIEANKSKCEKEIDVLMNTITKKQMELSEVSKKYVLYSKNVEKLEVAGNKLEEKNKEIKEKSEIIVNLQAKIAELNKEFKQNSPKVEELSKEIAKKAQTLKDIEDMIAFRTRKEEVDYAKSLLK